MKAVSSGLALWMNNVVPSLLPFFIGTELLMHTNVVNIIGNLLTPIMKPLFNVPGQGAFILIMGIICGYPTGAKIVTELRNNNILTKVQAERLLSFTNNSGPLFIIGSVGIGFFGDTKIGILMLIIHIISCFCVGFCFRFWGNSKRNDVINYKSDSSKIVRFSNLGEILGNSIMNSIRTIVMIGGFVVLFSVIISILKQSHILDLICFILSPVFNFLHIDIEYVPGLLTGLLELTNGISQVATVPAKLLSINMILSSFLLGFGGLSVMLQVFSIISKSDISIKPYIIGKILHGCFAALYTFIILKLFPFLSLDLL